LKQKKEGWDEAFDTEKTTYLKLRCLQGTIIPTYYGQVQFEGKPALVLSDIGGVCVAEPKGAVLREEHIEPLFHQALSALMSQGISHDDLKLDNFHLVRNSAGRAIMVLDLELVNDIPPETDREEIVQWDVNSLMREYRDHLECLGFDCLLLPFEPL
jgi:serine/threonine protein kinase